MAQFFSSDSIIAAYRTLVKNGVRNKFFGLLSLLRNADTPLVVPGITYEAYDNRISQWLDDVFFMEEYSNYNGGGSMYFKLAVGWDDVVKEMSTYSIDFVSLFCFIYKFKAFDDELTINEMMDLFLKDFHLPEQSLRMWCNLAPSNIEYSPSKCSRSTLKTKLAIHDSTITLETPSVKARAGELSRAPFIQTLYAGLDAIRCMIISKFNLDEFYPTAHAKPLNNSKDICNQIIFYGAPGTGKSHEVKRITGECDDEEKDNVFRTTFHPDTDYASFVGCYKPTMKDTGQTRQVDGKTEKVEEICYEFVPQVFTDAYVYAYENPGKDTFLVIEEINRGNCAQVFGDLFQLLDRKDDGSSEYRIKADKDLAKHLIGKIAALKGTKVEDVKLCLPKNLHILATMNTSDQSLFPMDSAFKRRWDWEYVPISYDEPKSSAFEIEIGGEKYPWVRFIKKVNKRIFDLTKSEDKMMGNFFIKRSVTAEQFRDKVMFYLWNEVLCDEVENSNYFFYGKDGDEKEKFTFKDLYENNYENTLKGFMRYLDKEQ